MAAVHLDAARTRAVLADVARSSQEAVLLVRGDDGRGSDVDLLALPAARQSLGDALRAAGLTLARAEDSGRMVWAAGDEVVLDVLPASWWPDYYPPLAGAFTRAQRAPELPPACSAEDRLLMLAAEAVAGHPIEKLISRASPLLALPGARDRLDRLARSSGCGALARLADPELLRSRARRGRLPYTSAVRAAARCRPARAALLTRIRSRLRLQGTIPPSSRRPRGALIAVSGMDGAGKSTLAPIVAAHLQGHGIPATVSWGRLAGESWMLERIATPVKRLLRPLGSIADAEAAAAPEERAQLIARRPPRRPGVVGWTWVAIVALVNARTFRAAARPRRKGDAVVCDRWMTDSLVDLRLRYGRHRLGELILRALVPRADLALALVVGAAVAGERKPGDQSPRILAEMQALYAQRIDADGLVALDGGAPLEEVARRACTLAELTAARQA